MRRYSTTAEPAPAEPANSLFQGGGARRSDWPTVRNLLPNVWH